MSLAQELDAFRTANAALLARDGDEQCVAKPEPVAKGIPTLAKGSYRAPSPQLASRFEAAGRWELAWLRERWLGIADMEEVWRDRAVQKQIALRRENWPTSAFGKTADGDASLFGIDVIENSETYLLWAKKGEPRVAAYTSSSETVYANLAAFVKKITAVTRAALQKPKVFYTFKDALKDPIGVEVLSVRVPSKSTRIPDFATFPRLRTLALNGNIGHWTEAPPSIWRCKSLRQLTINDSGIEALPPELGDLDNLDFLYLVNNRLTSLPAAIGRLRALESLVCANNRLAELPAEIGKLDRLEKLHCAGNRLTKLPAAIGKLARLRELNASRNQLTALPKGLFALEQLETIDVSRNALQRAPRELLALPSVKTVVTDFAEVSRG